MNDISISAKNPTTVQHLLKKIQRDEESEIILFNRQNDDTTDEQETSDGIRYIFFVLNFVIILILSFIGTIQGRQKINLIY
jgi:hypothetical protein